MLRRLVATLALLKPSSLIAQVDGDAIIVTGVVDGNGGGGGWQMRGKTSWTGLFHVFAWRVGDGPIRTGELRIEIPDQRADQLDKWASVFPKLTLVRFAIREPVVEKNGEILYAFAELRAPMPRTEDAELLAAAESILNAPPIVDPEFGTFTRDGLFGEWFMEPRDWLGHKIDVSLSLDFAGPPGPDAAQQALANLRGVWTSRDAWDARIREAIADEYYELWRDHWRAEDQPVIDREAFKARFRLHHLSFAPDGSFSAIFTEDRLLRTNMSVDYFAEDGTLQATFFG